MDVRELKDNAADFFRKGRFGKAADAYVQLVKLEPKEGQHLIKLGDSYRRDGKREQAIEAYRRAVDDYARQGIVIKAIAACKLILEIDANQKDAQEALATLCSKRYVKRDQIDAPAAPASRGMPAPRGRPTSIELPDDDGGDTTIETAGGATIDNGAKPAARAVPPRPVSRPAEPPRPPPRVEPSRVPPPRPAEPEAAGGIDIDFDLTEASLPPTSSRPAPPKEPEALDLDLGPPPAERSRAGATYDLTEELEELEELEAIEEPPVVASGAVELELVASARTEAARPPTPMADILSDSLLIEGEADDGEEVELLSITTGETIVTGPVAVSRGEQALGVAPRPPPKPDDLDELFTSGPSAPAPGPSVEELLRARERAEMAALANEASFDFAGPASREPEPAAEPEPMAPAIPSGDVDQQSVPLFSELPREAFLDLLERLTFRRVDAGEVILREGDAGKSIFVLASGKARVVKGHGSPKPLELATLDDGAFFGEMALLNGAPRVASVVALEDSEVLELTEALLRDLTARHPTVGVSLKKFYRQRLLSNVMAISPLFKAFDKGDRKMLVEKFKLREVTPGESIIKEGEKPDGLYVIMHGTALVTKKDAEAPRQMPLAVLKEGDVFGEMSLLTKKAATATVTAKRKTLVLRLPKAVFDELMFTHPAVLEVVSELTDQRTRVNEQILSGELEAPREALALL